jgi:hypothetical protein
VSKGQTISRLEALLARVRTRAAEPRSPVAAAVAAREAEAPPVGTPVFELDEPVEELEATQSRPVPQRAAPMVTETDIVMEVEVQAATQETVLAVPVEEAVAPEPTESRERLVAAEPVAAAPAAELEAPPVVAVQVEEVEEISLEPAVEEEQEAPVSSRRPVAPPPEARLEEMAFGNAEPAPPRHTPPPESGRLPAAPDAASDVEFEGDITGVRSATKSAHPAAAVPIVPQATIAELAPSDEVADVVGISQAPEPTTFVGMLDLSLAL